MSGGAMETVMGVFTSINGIPYSGYSISTNSGFNGLTGNDSSTYTAGIDFPNSKYYDKYTTTDPTTACNGGICYGHALSETSGWYNGYAYFVKSTYPWFQRGGQLQDIYAGVFYFRYGAGRASDVDSFRVVLTGA